MAAPPLGPGEPHRCLRSCTAAGRDGRRACHKLADWSAAMQRRCKQCTRAPAPRMRRRAPGQCRVAGEHVCAWPWQQELAKSQHRGWCGLVPGSHPPAARQAVSPMATCVPIATEPMEADALPRAGPPAAPEVHVVTVEEAAAGAYGIERVVLPLPGASVRYPEHATAQVRSQFNDKVLDNLLLAPVASWNWWWHPAPGGTRPAAVVSPELAEGFMVANCLSYRGRRRRTRPRPRRWASSWTRRRTRSATSAWARCPAATAAWCTGRPTCSSACCSTARPTRRWPPATWSCCAAPRRRLSPCWRPVRRAQRPHFPSLSWHHHRTPSLTHCCARRLYVNASAAQPVERAGRLAGQ